MPSIPKDYERVGKHGVRIERTGTAKDEATRRVIQALDAAEPDTWQDPNRLEGVVSGALTGARGVTVGKDGKPNFTASSIPQQHRAAIERYVEARALEFEAHRVKTGRGLSGAEAAQALGRPLSRAKPTAKARQDLRKGPKGNVGVDVSLLNEPKPPGYNEANAKALEKKAAELARERSKASEDFARGLGGRDNGGLVAGGSKVYPTGKATKKQHKAAALKLMGEQWGMSRTAAQALINKGFDPFNPPKTLDAQALGIKAPTIRRLQAQGLSVRNTPAEDAGGYSKAELASGKGAGLSSARGADRAERMRRKFRKRVVYEEGSDGGIKRTELAPRHSAKNAGKAIKKSTLGAWRARGAARERERDAKRLDKPLHRIKAIEEVEQRRSVIELQGRLEDAHESGSSWKQSYYRARLSVTKWVLVHKFWASLVLMAAIAFVPWLGLLTWAGWGLGALGLTLLKAAAFVLVTAYHVIAAVLVNFIGFLGNLIAGGFEAMSGAWLRKIGLDSTVCDVADASKCESRLFAYTVPRVDTSFPGFPELPKPSHFDSRTVFELVLGLFGLQFDVFNRLLGWFRGGQ